MQAGDRVRFNDEETFPSLGTITRVSPAGFVRVKWDSSCTPGLEDYWSPFGAKRVLTVVTGIDAQPRHCNDNGWKKHSGPCTACGVEITDQNWKDPCPGTQQ